MSNWPKKFRKKPVVIEAVRFVGTIENTDAIVGWTGAEAWGSLVGDDAHITIRTLEGEMTASLGDWIIRGTAGEFYPCKPDIFTDIYEEVGHE